MKLNRRVVEALGALIAAAYGYAWLYPAAYSISSLGMMISELKDPSGPNFLWTLVAAFTFLVALTSYDATTLFRTWQSDVGP